MLVEGGFRTIKKYKRLLLNRIRWDNVADIEDENNNAMEKDNEVSSNDFKCHLVWEGNSNQSIFGKFQTFYNIKSD